MSTKHSILLKTEALSIGYREVLLENLSLQLNAGELVCFMGPNGIGKSTLIRTLAGLQKPLSGKVSHTTNLQDLTKQISVVLTDRINTVNMTVRELISYGRYPYLNWNIQLTEHDNAIIQDAIHQVQINHLSDKKLDQLSDGQLQMVMIARALAQDTKIILLDEPTAHLDLNNRVEVMKLLKRLAHNMNKAILISTHELDLALQMADVIWITGKEKNIISGIPEDLVLGNTFDDIFQFKGFDLKTGKVQHEIDQQLTLELTGDGYEYLWTRNALERNGFAVKTENTDLKISIRKGKEGLQWEVNQVNLFNSLHDVLIFLNEYQIKITR